MKDYVVLLVVRIRIRVPSASAGFLVCHLLLDGVDMMWAVPSYEIFARDWSTIDRWQLISTIRSTMNCIPYVQDTIKENSSIYKERLL